MRDPAHFKKILPPIGRGDCEFKLDLSKANDFCRNANTPSDKVFAALFWLRRGIAERDPLDTYSALMICLQILACDCNLLTKKPESKSINCPSCKTEISISISISSLVKELITNELNAPEELADRIWTLRNKLVAHGNKTPLDADTFIELTELKFSAAELAFNGVSLAMGLDYRIAPALHKSFFVTDALMYLD
jgi:hypothetical protein